MKVEALELYKQNHLFVQSDLNGEASYGLISADNKELYISYTSETYSTIGFINATKAGEKERGSGRREVGGWGWRWWH